VKTVWLYGLLSLLSIVASCLISITLSGAGEPRFDTKASPSTAASPLPLNTAAGANAGAAAAGGSQNSARSIATPAPGATNKLAANLADYVFLHETRNESIPLQVPHAQTCAVE
jgi:hypothetical protein